MCFIYASHYKPCEQLQSGDAHPPTSVLSPLGHICFQKEHVCGDLPNRTDVSLAALLRVIFASQLLCKLETMRPILLRKTQLSSHLSNFHVSLLQTQV